MIINESDFIGLGCRLLVGINGEHGIYRQGMYRTCGMDSFYDNTQGLRKKKNCGCWRDMFIILLIKFYSAENRKTINTVSDWRDFRTYRTALVHLATYRPIDRTKQS
jgi:hypothetical protein